MSSGEDKIRAKIKEIEIEYARTQKNKATEGHLGLLKAKLSKLRRELTDAGSAGKKGGGAGERGFEVSKSGDTRVGLIGFPSVGKSTLLTKLTGTFSLAAGYEFTTLTAIPGTMHYRGAKIQILDLPGIIEGAKDGKGRGRQVLAAAPQPLPTTRTYRIEMKRATVGWTQFQSVCCRALPTTCSLPPHHMIELQ